MVPRRSLSVPPSARTRRAPSRPAPAARSAAGARRERGAGGHDVVHEQARPRRHRASAAWIAPGGPAQPRAAAAADLRAGRARRGAGSRPPAARPRAADRPRRSRRLVEGRARRGGPGGAAPARARRSSSRRGRVRPTISAAIASAATRVAPWNLSALTSSRGRALVGDRRPDRRGRRAPPARGPRKRSAPRQARQSGSPARRMRAAGPAERRSEEVEDHSWRLTQRA